MSILSKKYYIFYDHLHPLPTSTKHIFFVFFCDFLNYDASTIGFEMVPGNIRLNYDATTMKFFVRQEKIVFLQTIHHYQEKFDETLQITVGRRRFF